MSKQTIDEIVKETLYFKQSIDGRWWMNDWEDDITEEVNDLKAAIQVLIDEVIGPDTNSEAFEQSSGTSGYSVRDSYQNQLRAEQRQRKRELMGESDG